MKPIVFWMRRALRLAEKAKDKSLPNPKVGAIFLDEKGELLGEGYHPFYGGPHAEVEAYGQVKDPSKIHSAILTLEPCLHHGKTPPCLDLLLSTPLKKIWIASLDPNPLMAGKSCEKLREAGVEVQVGLLEAEARKLNEKFYFFHENKKPWVSLKMATSLNHKIGPSREESYAITGKKVQKKVHLLRRAHHAILVGSHTVKVDDPHLGVYLLEDSREPLRILWGKSLSEQELYQVFRDENYWISRAESVEDLLQQAYEKNIQSILVEGGPKVWQAFFEAGAVQEIIHAMSPNYEAQHFVEASAFQQKLELELLDCEKVGLDIWLRLRPFEKRATEEEELEQKGHAEEESA